MRYSNKTFQNLLPRLGLLALVVPVAGFGASLQVSSSGGPTVCTSTCPDPNSTSTAAGVSPASGTVSGAYSLSYTLNDGDTYQISANYIASYTSGVSIIFNPTVTYTGSSAAVAADSISLDLYQNFYDTAAGAWNGTYCEYFPTTAPANVSSTANLTFGGSSNPQSIGTISGVTGTTTSKCTGLTFNTAQNASPYLNADYNITFNFAAGATTGTSASSITVPEPSAAALAVLGGSSLLYFVRRRRSAK